MSQSQRTYQTTTTLNVSQEYETPARSSSSPEQAAPEGVTREATELVEDSLNANAPAVADDIEVVEDSFRNRAAAIANTTNANRPTDRPSQRAQSQHDELYSLTPERPRAEAVQDLPNATKHAESQRKVSNNALDALLARGAIVHTPVQKPARTDQPSPIVEDEEDELQKSQGERNAPTGVPAPKSAAKGKRSLYNGRAQHSGEDEVDELQSFGDDVSAPLLSSKKKAKASTAAKSTSAYHVNNSNMTSKAPPVSATGSLAALRQRRGQDTGGLACAPTHSNANSVLQPRDANAQTPAPISKDGTKKAQPESTASAAGKLPPVTRGVFAQTPIAKPSGQAQKRVTATARVKERADHSAYDSNATVKSGPKSTQKAADKRQSLKRPTKTMKDTCANEASTYDVPQSPEDENDDDYRPNKKTRKGKAAQRKRIVATSSAAGTPAPAKKTARKFKAKAPKPSPDPEGRIEAAGAGPSKSTRSRMKADSGTVAPVTNAEKDATAGKEVQKDLQEIAQSDTEMRDAGHDEIDDGPIGQSSGNYADQSAHERSAEAATNEITKIKRGRLDNDHRPMQKMDRSKRDRGASQQDAIELSDAQSSSDEEPSPLHESEAPGPPAPLKQPNLGHRQPRTPAAVGSSPLVAGNPSTKPTTAGLVDPESVMKPTIISFDKSGPRNQGTLSARPSRPSLAPTNRSSPPPTGADGSLARLQAKRQGQPSSAAKNSKSFAREASAAASNVAGDAQEALAAMRQRSIAPIQPVSNKQAAPESRYEQSAISKQAYLDDDSADMDQFGDDTTFIGDQEPPTESKVNPIRSPRTLSQIEMPPPISKTEQKRPVNRAPTVPSMMQAEVQNVRHPSDTAADKSILGKRQHTGDSTAINVRSKRARRKHAIEPAASQQTGSMDSLTETTVVQRKAPIPDRQAEPSQRRAGSQRETKRQRSQGTVDIYGSPVPEGMVVGGLNTVLETFSQQATISSDHQVDADGKGSTRHLGIESSDLLPVKAAQKQPTHASSNTKAVPAEPSQESQAITHVARVPAGRQPFVTTVQIARPPTDPFTNSEKERNPTGRGSSTSAFSEHLKRKAGQVAANRNMVRMPPPQADEEDDDPEKTLVEEEAEVSRPQRQPKRIESFDSQSSSDMSTDTEDASASLRDLSVWRTALKPHQMNLFDELVIISHRLVRHLADEEEAATTIVDDYRRRGEELLQSLRVAQAKHMKQYYGSLKEKKKKLQRELSQASQRLAKCSGEANTVRKQVRKQAAVAKASEAMELQDVMEAFC